jgi:hypothetical protein
MITVVKRTGVSARKVLHMNPVFLLMPGLYITTKSTWMLTRNPTDPFGWTVDYIVVRTSVNELEEDCDSELASWILAAGQNGKGKRIMEDSNRLKRYESPATRYRGSISIEILAIVQPPPKILPSFGVIWLKKPDSIRWCDWVESVTQSKSSHH